MFDNKISLYLDVRYNVQTVQFYYARNEVGHLVNLRQHQNNLHLFLCSERVEQNLNLVSCLSVKSYKRVLYDKHFRLGKQVGCKLVFAQLTAAQKYDIFIKQILHVEELVQMLLELSAFRSIFASQHVSLFKLGAHGGSLLINLSLVPTLLQEVCAVVIATIRIAERYGFQVVVRFGERIAYTVRRHRVFSCNHVYQHTLTSTVSTNDG